MPVTVIVQINGPYRATVRHNGGEPVTIEGRADEPVDAHFGIVAGEGNTFEIVEEPIAGGGATPA